MLLLEVTNRIILDAIRSRLVVDPNEKFDTLDITCADFDDVTYHITSSADTPNILLVSIAMRCAEDLKKNGALDLLQKEYGKLLVATETGFDVSLQVDVKDLPGDRDRLIAEVASIKRNLFAGPLVKAFETVSAGNTFPPVAIEYRPNEHVFIVPQKDQVVIIFSIVFRDASDIPIAKVFLQEFAEARRQGGLGTAPPVTHSDDVPLELKGLSVQPAKNKSFVSFVIFPRNWEAAKRKATIDMLQQFRDYLHYHIKCSKAYMHTRMRARVVSWLKVLKQAVPEIPGYEKEKKTASGRTFQKK